MYNILKITILFLVFISNCVSAQDCDYYKSSDAPKEHAVGRLEITGMRTGHPYTMFVKDDGFELNSRLYQIRKNLILSKIESNQEFQANSYAQLYRDIITMASSNSSTFIGSCSKHEGCFHPAWVKDNALVYLIGLKYEKSIYSGNDTLVEMPVGDENTVGTRKYYAGRAAYGLSNLNPEVVVCLSGDDCGKLRTKAFDLIQYLEGYDMLRSGGYISDEQDKEYLKCNQRMKLRELTKNLYRQSNLVINSSTGWKKNHGIICASALAMSALVLNKAGESEKTLKGFYNFLFKGAPWPHPAYSPINWYRRGMGDGDYNVFYATLGYIFGEGYESGLTDNFFVGWHALSHNVPQTSSDGMSGFAEGPGYYCDLSQAFYPFLRTNANSFPHEKNKNLLLMEKYLNIIRWHRNIMNHDNSCPTFDNTEHTWGNLECVLGLDEFSCDAKYINQLQNQGGSNSKMDLRGDYILAMGGGINIPLDYYYNEKSGNIVFRNNITNSKQTFQMLCEKDDAIDAPASRVDQTHEDDDLGSWTICAQDRNNLTGEGAGDNWLLAIDPGYRGWGHEDATNKYSMHNTIEVDDGYNVVNHFFFDPVYSKKEDLEIDDKNKIQNFNLSYQFLNPAYSTTPANNFISRDVNIIKADDEIYYLFNDFVDMEASGLHATGLSMNINGNGRNDFHESNNITKPMSFRKDGNLYMWTHPCGIKPDAWQLIYHVAALNNQTSNKEIWDRYTLNASDGISYGDTHTRLEIHQPVKKTIFQSFIYPHKCNGDSLPKITVIETPEHVTTKINFIHIRDTSFDYSLKKNHPLIPTNGAKDTVSHCHFAQWDGNIVDSILNPFNLSNQSNSKLKLNAQKAFIKNNTLGISLEGNKYCPPSFANIRYVGIYNGSYISYKDTNLIYSDKLVNASFGFAGRFNYKAYIEALDSVTSTDSITFLLADVGRGIDMVALNINNNKDTLKGRYDSLTRIFHLLIPANKISFEMKEKVNCLDCFFPPASDPFIKSDFFADDGKEHKLGHKLTIEPDTGTLYIQKGTKISMCPGAYIRNRDSLILEGPCQTKNYILQTCKGIDTLLGGSKNSAIIVSAGSCLLLDSSSLCHIRNGAGIYIKANGSLIVKNYAKLIIGDSGTCQYGFGEIIAEPGAFIDIEPLAHIEYRRTAGDTADRNLFVLPVATTYAGIYYAIHTILRADTVMPDTNFAFNPIAVCDLDSINPIANREWGFTSFGKPLATFQTRNDTLCPGEPLYVKLNRILNDVSYKITLCRVDSIHKYINNTWLWQDTCVVDTIMQDTVLPDPVCKEPRTTPDEWTFKFRANTLHRLTIKVWNDCGRMDDTVAYIYAADTPRFHLNVISPACEGIGTVSAIITDSIFSPVYYALDITEIPDTTHINIVLHNQSESYSEAFYGYLPDTFHFPGYYFKGARSYLLSLTVTNGCGSYSVFDTLKIPAGVSIVLERPTLYAQPVNGATSVALHGYTTSVDSFRWEPTTWLDNPSILTPTSNPLDSITYFLIAHSGACVASDTVHIKYNRYDNAGYNDTLCFDSNTVSTEMVIGFPYDMSLFLGILYYYSPTDFMSYYNVHNISNNPLYLRYFTHYMHYSTYKDQSSSCPVDLYNLFTNTIDKELFFKQSWFKSFYKDFTSFSDPSMPALATFNTAIHADPTLSGLLDGLDTWTNILPCIDGMFLEYDNYVSGHSGEINTSWSKIVDGDTSNLSSWSDYFMAVDAPTKSSTYVLSIITPDYAEIDEISVLFDTSLNVVFAPALQFDSTVYIMNYTTPESSATTFEWNFGDGSTHSIDINPMHTFSAFDSNYVICLTANNRCGTWTYCDTVWIDSAHWGGSLFTEKNPISNSNSNNQSQSKSTINNKIQKQINSGIIPIALTNYPNPFGTSTIIDYEIWQNYSNAELKITNTLGQQVFSQKLIKPVDKIQIDGSALHDGLYYYSIIIDGSVKQTKSMAVMH